MNDPRELLLTAEDALSDALAACQARANETAEASDWRAATELRIARRHVGAAIVAIDHAAAGETPPL